MATRSSSYYYCGQIVPSLEGANLWGSWFSKNHHAPTSAMLVLPKQELLVTSTNSTTPCCRYCSTDPYVLLQIRRDAVPSEIRHNYKRLALLHHPCRSNNNNYFVALAAAYETLMDPDTRQTMNKLLDKQQQPTIQMNTVKTCSPNQQQQQQQQHPGGCILGTTPENSNTATATINSSFFCKAAADFFWDTNNPANTTDKKSPMPALLKSSSWSSMSSKSSDDDDDDSTLAPHYSTETTDRLFGGTLELMYRARQYQEFTNPQVIFHRVFHSSLIPTSTANNNKATTEKRLPHTCHHEKQHAITTASPFSILPVSSGGLSTSHLQQQQSSSTESRLDDGTVICTNARDDFFNHKTISRTVTRRPNQQVVIQVQTKQWDDNDCYVRNDASAPNKQNHCNCCLHPTNTSPKAQQPPTTATRDASSLHAAKKQLADKLDDATANNASEVWSLVSTCRAWFLPFCV